MSKLWVRRKAVSSIIGGIIVLGLFLSALTAMIVLNQQYDVYQGTSDQMVQRDINRFSENIRAIYPGLKGGFPATGCGSQCNQYNMSLANLGGIAVQIVRIYLNSTQNTSGCVTGPCVFNPTQATTSFSFNMFDAYLNPGEINHIVRMWLPSNIVLPNASLTPGNSIWIVTSRGRVFSFQWPFPPVGMGLPGTGTPPTLYSGSMKVAYTGTTLNSQTDTLHTETRKVLPVPYTEAGGGTKLYFVNPWITDGGGCPSVLSSASGIYISAYTVNSLSFPITFSWGNMIVLAGDSASESKSWFIGGPYYGIVYNQSGVQTFTTFGTPVTLSPGSDFYLIYKVDTTNGVNVGTPTYPGDTFSGTATIHNGYQNQAEGSDVQTSSFRAVEIFLDGLFVRVGNGSCSL